MAHVVLIDGAPGSGKSTLAAAASRALGSPNIDFGRLREFHLDRDWSTAGPGEERMAAENLIFILNNYIAHGYRNILVHDLRREQLSWVAGELCELEVVVCRLHVDPDVLRARVAARSTGFTDVAAALLLNERILAEAPRAHELLIDSSSKDVGLSVRTLANWLDTRRAALPG